MKQLVTMSVVVMAIMACVGCSQQSTLFQRTPLLTQAECFPQYLGQESDSVTFAWQGRNFKRLEVLTAAGDPILILRAPEGSVTTPPITSEMLPLQAVAWWKDQGTTVPINLAVTEKPVWTKPYASVAENGGELESKFSRVEQERNPEGVFQTVKVYELFQQFDSFTWEIPENHFGDNVALEKIRNAGVVPLIVSGKGITSKTLEPNGVFTVPDNTQLTGAWTLKMAEPVKRKVGEQRGESEAGITITDIQRTAHLEFLIQAKETAVAEDKKKIAF